MQQKVHPKARSTQKRRAKPLASMFRWVHPIRLGIFAISHTKQLFTISTAIIIALQYFCSDRALFAFERSPQAFWISIGILTSALMALTAFLHAFNRLKDHLFVRLIEKCVDLVPVTTSDMRHTDVEAIGVRDDNPLQVLEV
jgi:hypothetical protein